MNTYDLGPFPSRAEADAACQQDLALGATACEVVEDNGQFFARVTEDQGDDADDTGQDGEPDA